jgi:hypothetical protein
MPTQFIKREMLAQSVKIKVLMQLSSRCPRKEALATIAEKPPHKERREGRKKPNKAKTKIP